MSFFVDERTENVDGKEFLVFTYRKSLVIMNYIVLVAALVAGFSFLISINTKFNFITFGEFLLAAVIILGIPIVLLTIDTKGKNITPFRARSTRMVGNPYSFKKLMEYWVEK